MAAPGDAELESLVAGAAHDLREPLQTALGYLDVLASRLDGRDPLAEECLREAQGGLLRIRSTLEDLLAYARAPAAAHPNERVDVAQELDGVLHDLKPLLAGAHATVEAKRLPVVSGHAPHVRRIVQNLLSNAVKYRSAA